MKSFHRNTSPFLCPLIKIRVQELTHLSRTPPRMYDILRQKSIQLNLNLVYFTVQRRSSFLCMFLHWFTSPQGLPFSSNPWWRTSLILTFTCNLLCRSFTHTTQTQGPLVKLDDIQMLRLSTLCTSEIPLSFTGSNRSCPSYTSLVHTCTSNPGVASKWVVYKYFVNKPRLWEDSHPMVPPVLSVQRIPSSIR